MVSKLSTPFYVIILPFSSYTFVISEMCNKKAKTNVNIKPDINKKLFTIRHPATFFVALTNYFSITN